MDSLNSSLGLLSSDPFSDVPCDFSTSCSKEESDPIDKENQSTPPISNDGTDRFSEVFSADMSSLNLGESAYFEQLDTNGKDFGVSNDKHNYRQKFESIFSSGDSLHNSRIRFSSPDEHTKNDDSEWVASDFKNVENFKQHLDSCEALLTTSTDEQNIAEHSSGISFSGHEQVDISQLFIGKSYPLGDISSRSDIQRPGFGFSPLSTTQSLSSGRNINGESVILDEDLLDDSLDRNCSTYSMLSSRPALYYRNVAHSGGDYSHLQMLELSSTQFLHETHTGAHVCEGATSVCHTPRPAEQEGEGGGSYHTDKQTEAVVTVPGGAIAGLCAAGTPSVGTCVQQRHVVRTCRSEPCLLALDGCDLQRRLAVISRQIVCLTTEKARLENMIRRQLWSATEHRRDDVGDVENEEEDGEGDSTLRLVDVYGSHTAPAEADCTHSSAAVSHWTSHNTTPRDVATVVKATRSGEFEDIGSRRVDGAVVLDCLSAEEEDTACGAISCDTVSRHVTEESFENLPRVDCNGTSNRRAGFMELRLSNQDSTLSLKDESFSDNNRDVMEKLLKCSPAVVSSHVVCIGISTTVSVPIANISSCWLRIHTSISDVLLNGLQYKTEELIQCSLPNSLILEPFHKHVLMLTIVCLKPGKLDASITVSTSFAGNSATDILSSHNHVIKTDIVCVEPKIYFSDQSLKVIDFGTLAENCTEKISLSFRNSSICSVPAFLKLQSPDDIWTFASCASDAQAISHTVQKCTLSSQHEGCVTVDITLRTPLLPSASDCSVPSTVRGSFAVVLDTHLDCEQTVELLSVDLLVCVGRVKLRVGCREPLHLVSFPSQTVSSNVPLRNSGSIPLQLSVSVGGPQRDYIWVRPTQVTVPCAETRELQLTYQPDATQQAQGVALLLMRVQPAGPCYEFYVRCGVGHQDSAGGARRCVSRTESERSEKSEKSARERRSRSQSPKGGGCLKNSSQSATDIKRANSQHLLHPSPNVSPIKMSEQIHLRSNRSMLVWLGVSLNQRCVSTLLLRSSATCEIPLTASIHRDAEKFCFVQEVGTPAKRVTRTCLKLSPGQDLEVAVAYLSPVRPCVSTSEIVFRPQISHKQQPFKYRVPLVAYCGHSAIQLAGVQDKLSLGEIRPGFSNQITFTVCNRGNRIGFVKLLLYWDSSMMRPVSARMHNMSCHELILPPGTRRTVRMAVRVPADFTHMCDTADLDGAVRSVVVLRVVSGDEVFRQAYKRRRHSLQTSSVSPNLLLLNLANDICCDEEVLCSQYEIESLSSVANISEAFLTSISDRHFAITGHLNMADSSAALMMSLKADATLGDTTSANTTLSRAEGDSAVAVTDLHSSSGHDTPPVRDINNKKIVVDDETEFNNLCAGGNTACSPPALLFSAQSTESGPITPAAVAADTAAPTQCDSLMGGDTVHTASGAGCALGQSVDGSTLLSLDTDKLHFPTAPVHSSSVAQITFSNISEQTLEWTLEELLAPWYKEQIGSSQSSRMSARVFQFQPTEGLAAPGQSVVLDGLFSPPAVGCFSTTVYLVIRKHTSSHTMCPDVPMSCLWFYVQGQGLCQQAALRPAPSLVQQPSAAAGGRSGGFPLCVQPATLVFSKLNSVQKLCISNRHRVDYTFSFKVSGPFVVRHETMLARATRYINVPVAFRLAEESARLLARHNLASSVSLHGTIVLSLTDNPSQSFTVQLQATM